MDGLETFKLIHEKEPKLPVIIMTAYGTTETAIEATKLGAFDFILKPFDIPEMLEVIRKALEAGKFMRSHVDLNPRLRVYRRRGDHWNQQVHAGCL
jgi:DNA-binding NtrC family response regulator